jgi:peptidoglycan/LPS O-acetylase OafA/YrhL
MGALGFSLNRISTIISTGDYTMLAQNVLYYAAAATTAIAGILHLTLAPNMLDFNPNGAILFFVGGATQIFWALPMIRKWGRVWYGVGIAGTLILIAIWIITRMPGNPITGRGGMINEMGIAVEVMEWAFVGLTAGIIVFESKRKQLNKKNAADAA